MADKLPVVLDQNAQLQRLQPGDNLEIPLEQRVDELESRLKCLTQFLALQGFEVPE